MRSAEALLADWEVLGMPFQSSPRLLAELPHDFLTNKQPWRPLVHPLRNVVRLVLILAGIAILVLPRQDLHLAKHILRRTIISDMRSRELWEKELSLIRHIVSLGREEQAAFIRELEAAR